MGAWSRPRCIMDFKEEKVEAQVRGRLRHLGKERQRERAMRRD